MQKGNIIDLRLYKYIKQVVKLGIPRHKAEEIVTCALETGNGAYVEMYIKYAVNLNYGLGLSK